MDGGGRGNISMECMSGLQTVVCVYAASSEEGNEERKGSCSQYEGIFVVDLLGGIISFHFIRLSRKGSEIFPCICIH